MKDIKDKVSDPCFFRVTHKQMEHIKTQFQESGMNSFSAFLRQQVVCGLHLQSDNEECIMIQNSILSCSCNINQIDGNSLILIKTTTQI